MAMPMPAAMTANGPTQPPVPPSAAWARAGTRSTAIPARTDERRTSPSSSRCAAVCFRLVMRRMRLLVMVAVLGVLDAARDVQHGEHDEDEGLEERHQDLQGIDESDRECHHHQAAHARSEERRVGNEW